MLHTQHKDEQQCSDTYIPKMSKKKNTKQKKHPILKKQEEIPASIPDPRSAAKVKDVFSGPRPSTSFVQLSSVVFVQYAHKKTNLCTWISTQLSYLINSLSMQDTHYFFPGNSLLQTTNPH